MKKIFVLTAGLLLAATCAFAVDNGTTINDFGTTGAILYGDETDATSDPATSIGQSSTGVGVAWQTSATAYALMTQHKSGTKAYGTSFDSTAIYQTKGSVDPETPAYNSGALTASDTTDFVTTGWSSM